MSYEFAATHNSRAACLDLCEAIADRYAPEQKCGLDIASLRQIAAKAIASGALVPPTNYALTPDQIIWRQEHEKRQAAPRILPCCPPSSSPEPTLQNEPQGAVGKTLAKLQAEAKLDRVVSLCRHLSPLKHGELARIAAAEKVDYERLQDRLSGRTKRSQM